MHERVGHGSDYYEYHLRGVVLHVGTADAGHYCSIIRSRGVGPGTWFLFNDNVVTEFDERELEAQCFGGSACSAFLLVYDRRSLDESAGTRGTATGSSCGGGCDGDGSVVRPPSSGAGVGAGIGARVSADRNSIHGSKKRPVQGPGMTGRVQKETGEKLRGKSGVQPGRGIETYDAERAVPALASTLKHLPLPEPLAQEVAADNTRHWHEQHVLTSRYFSWMRSLLVCCKPKPVLTYPQHPIRFSAEAGAAGGAGMHLARLAVLFLLHTAAPVCCLYVCCGGWHLCACKCARAVNGVDGTLFDACVRGCVHVS